MISLPTCNGRIGYEIIPTALFHVWNLHGQFKFLLICCELLTHNYLMNTCSKILPHIPHSVFLVCYFHSCFCLLVHSYMNNIECIVAILIGKISWSPRINILREHSYMYICNYINGFVIKNRNMYSVRSVFTKAPYYSIYVSNLPPTYIAIFHYLNLINIMMLCYYWQKLYVIFSCEQLNCI